MQKQKGEGSLVLRVVSIVVLTAFFGTGLAPAQPPAAVSPLKPDQISEVNPLSRIQIPEELGTVREALSPPASQSQIPTVIHIQDAHGSYEAQIKIKKILDLLVRDYGVSLILVEGASERLDPGLFRMFKNQSLNLKAADFLAREGELSGTELYLLEADERIRAEGIEDPEMYGQNLKTFREMASKRLEIRNEFGALRTQIEMLGSRVWNKNLRKFLKGWQSWRAEQLSLPEFLFVIQAAARKHLQIDLEDAAHQFDYPMLVRYYKMKALESEIDLAQAEQERARLLSFLAANEISPAVRDRIQHWDFKKGISDWSDADPRHFLGQLFEAASPHGFHFEHYPALVLLWASLIFQSELQSQSFFREIDKATNRILGALALSEEEQELVSLFRNSVLLEKLLLLELTREEYRVFLESPDDFRLTGLLERFRQLREQNGVSKKNQEEKHVLGPAELARLETKALFFYRTALERENAFFGHVDRMFHEHQAHSAVLVTGGFHSEGLKKQCSERSYSYVEISPRMTSFENLDKVYLQSMLERSQISAARRMAPHWTSENPAYLAERFEQAVQNAIQASSNISERELPDLAAQFNRIYQSRGYQANIVSSRFAVRHMRAAGGRERKQKPGSRSEARTGSFETMEGIDLIRRLPELNQAISAAKDEPETADSLIALRRGKYIPQVRKALEGPGGLSRNLMSELPGPKELMMAMARRLGRPNPHESDLLIPLLRSIDEKDWEIIAADEEISRLLARELILFYDYMNRPDTDTWVSKNAAEIQAQTIVYLSNEFGSADTVFGAGGLGVLAGNHFYGASDVGLPLIGIGIAAKKGYLRQIITPSGEQGIDDGYKGIKMEDLPFESVMITNPETNIQEELIVSIPFPGRQVKAKVWLGFYGKNRLYLLDTDIEGKGNTENDREITQRLYPGSSGSFGRMQQYYVLGVGGALAERALGIQAAVHHLNDAHPVFAVGQFVAQEMKNLSVVEDPALKFEIALEHARANLAFTTHTPVAAGNEVVDIPNVLRPFLDQIFEGNTYAVDRILALGARFDDQMPVSDRTRQLDKNHFDVVAFLLRVARFRNGVSALHGEVARQMWKGKVFPGLRREEVPIGHVTNSVHQPTFQAPEIAALFQSTFEKPQVQEAMKEDLRDPGAEIRDPNWLDDPENVDVSNEELWSVHRHRKTLFAGEIKRRMQSRLKGFRASELERELLKEEEKFESFFDPDALWIGYARRIVDYKRALLIFRDLDRLARIAAKAKKPIRLMFAGKAHPSDPVGQSFIQGIHYNSQLLAEHGANIKVVFVEGYDIHLARFMESGIDVWLNNPRRQYEASGTSGQKVAMNGGLNLTTHDGWNEEGVIDGVNGFRFGVTAGVGDDAIDSTELYDKLEEVIDIYDDHRGDWIRKMKAAVLSSTYRFGMERMLGEYTQNIYLPAARAGASLSIGGAKQNAERRIRKREEILTAFKSVGSKPSVQISPNVSKHVLRGKHLTVSAIVDLKDLRPEDIGVDVRYRLRREGQEAQWEGMTGGEVNLDLGPGFGKGHYWVRAAIPFTELGTYDIQVRLMPRDLISWRSIDELSQVTVYSEPYTVTTFENEDQLLRELMKKVDKRNFIVTPPDGKETPAVVWEVEAKFPNGNVDMDHWDFYVYWQDGQRKWHANLLQSRVVVNPEAVGGGENVFLLLNMNLEAGSPQPVFSKIFTVPKQRDFVVTENPADGNWKERKELIWEGTPFDDDLVRKMTRVYSDPEQGDEPDPRRAEVRVAAASDFSDVDLAVVQGAAQSVLDPAIAPSFAIGIFNQLIRPRIAGSIDETPFVLHSELEAAYQAHAAAFGNILGKQPSVVLSAGLGREQSLASHLEDIQVVRAILNMGQPIEVNVADSNDLFRGRMENIILKLSAREKGLFSRHFNFSQESFYVLAASQGKKGSGVLVADSVDQLARLDKKLAVLIADLSTLKRSEARELVVPVLTAAAALGALANGKTAGQLELIRAQYAKQLEDLGIVELSIDRAGRLVGRLLIEKIREWLTQHRSELRVKQAA